MPTVPDDYMGQLEMSQRQPGGLLNRQPIPAQNLLMAAADMQDRGRLTHDSFKPTRPTGPVNLHARSGGKAGKLR